MSRAIGNAARAMPQYPGRAQWEALLRPVVEPLAVRYSGHVVQRLLGFWVLWSVYGGRAALVESGMLTERSAYRAAAEFREVFGMEVSEFLPEVGRALAGAKIAARVDS